METLKRIPRARVKRIQKNPFSSGLQFQKFGKSTDIDDYSEQEIFEMLNGIYKDSKHLLVDGDYFIDLNKVVAAKAVLKEVTYHKEPTQSDYLTNGHNFIENIRAYYIEDYVLVTSESIADAKEHQISNFLHKTGTLKKGRNRFSKLFRIANNNHELTNQKLPKVIFDPITKSINELFFPDSQGIQDFVLLSDIEVLSEK